MTRTLPETLSRSSVIGLAFLSLVTSASAQSMRTHREAGWPDSLQMTCQQAEALVKAKGNTILRTGPYIQDRYLSTGAVCSQERKGLQSAFVRTRDSEACYVGYTCIPWETRNRD